MIDKSFFLLYIVSFRPRSLRGVEESRKQTRFLGYGRTFARDDTVHGGTMSVLKRLAANFALGDLLQDLHRTIGPSRPVTVWKQTCSHSDVVIRVHDRKDLPGHILVIAIDCNGGVKEVLCFDEVPDRWALWHWRCPSNPEFKGDIPPLLDSARTQHWFDPNEICDDNSYCELRPEFRQRQRCGGFVPIGDPLA